MSTLMVVVGAGLGLAPWVVIHRKRRVTGALVTALLSCIAPAAGCGETFAVCVPARSSTSSSGAAGTGGAQTTTGTGGTPDGGGGGAGGALLPRSILVLNQRGKLMVDVPLVVNDASGAVVTTTKTDAWGSAKLVIPDDGSVSAFYSEGLDFSVTTFVAPPHATSIAFGINQTFPADVQAIPTTYGITASQLPMGTTEFKCFSACQSATGNLGNGACQVTTTGCPGSVFEDLLVVAYAGAKPVGWGAAFQKPTSPGDTILISVTADQPVAPLPVTVTDIPAGATLASLTVFSGPSPSVGLPAKFAYDNPVLSIATSFDILAGGESTVRVRELIDLGIDSSTVVARDRSYQSAPSGSTFSAASIALVSVGPLDVHDPSHPVAGWSVGSGSRGDVGSAVIRWHAGAATASYTAYLPPDAATTFRIPDVPPELASYVPTAGSQFDGAFIRYTDYEAIDDYAGVVLRVANAALFPKVSGLGTVASFAMSAQLTP